MRFLLLAALVALAGCVQPSSAPYDEGHVPPPSHAAPASPSPSGASEPSPYAGEEVRAIKALSPDEIEGYQKGAGLGYAKPAELNSYPGPLHALEMADRLSLSPEQRAQIEAIRQDMLDKAVPLGERYLQVEAAIERHFREGSIDSEQLARLLEESGRIEAQLRFVHLDAHLATRALMTQHQVALYDEARGYGQADHNAHEHG